MSLGRIRTLKPENWHDEAVGSVGHRARLLRDVLITIADDDGRWRHLPSAIIGHGYPYDVDLTADELQAWAVELHEAGVIHLYEVDGTAYGCFPKWHNHQYIQKHRRSILPEPKGVRCARRTSGKPGSKASADSTDYGSPTGLVPEGSSSPPIPLRYGSGPDTHHDLEDRVPDPAPFPSTSDEGHSSGSARDVLEAVVRVLRTAPRLTFDPDHVGVANTIAAFVGYDHLAAARLAVARAVDPSWKTLDAARTLEYVLKSMPKPSTGSTAPPGRAGTDQRDADLAALQARLEAQEAAA